MHVSMFHYECVAQHHVHTHVHLNVKQTLCVPMTGVHPQHNAGHRIDSSAAVNHDHL